MTGESCLILSIKEFCSMHISTERPAASAYFHITISQPAAVAGLQKQLLRLSFLNLFLVSCMGLLLRSFPFLSSFPLQYKNVLHGHSHFAFGGWVMPILLALILKIFPDIAQKVAYKHWRNIVYMLFLSAYGMLLSFPVQGYAAVSIFFSTISVFAGFYLAIVIWKVTQHNTDIAIKFLRAGLVYLVLSSIGPFATGPIMAMGYTGSPLYHNAIYFYLHFQYNGWFVFALLAVLYKMLSGKEHHGKRVFVLFNIACVPAFALSVLWNEPGIVFNIIGGVAALLQVAGVVYIVKDIALLQWHNRFSQSLFTLAIIAFAVKNILQLASAFPVVAHMAAAYRNFVIAYLHLVLLGFVSLFAISVILQVYQFTVSRFIRICFYVFLLAFITTELLLVLNASEVLTGFPIPHFAGLMLFFTCFFPVAFMGLFKGIGFHSKTTVSAALASV